MIQYEVIEFYYGEWGGSCGKFDHLHDAIERQQSCEAQKEDMNESYHIIVRLPKQENVPSISSTQKPPRDAKPLPLRVVKESYDPNVTLEKLSRK